MNNCASAVAQNFRTVAGRLFAPHGPGRDRLLTEEELSPQRGVFIDEDVVEPPSAPGLLWLFGELGRYSLDLAVVSPELGDLMEQDAERLAEPRRLVPEAMIGAVHACADGVWYGSAPEIL